MQFSSTHCRFYEQGLRSPLIRACALRDLLANGFSRCRGSEEPYCSSHTGLLHRHDTSNAEATKNGPKPDISVLGLWSIHNEMGPRWIRQLRWHRIEPSKTWEPTGCWTVLSRILESNAAVCAAHSARLAHLRPLVA